MHACGSFAADSLEQDGEDGVAKTSTLVLREHGHVGHMEVRPAVA